MLYISQLGYVITNLGTTNYIAQHPKNSTKVEFSVNDQGLINMVRVR
jgi:hypothetical protein